MSRLRGTRRRPGHTFLPPRQGRAALQPLSHRCRGARGLPGCAPASSCSRHQQMSARAPAAGTALPRLCSAVTIEPPLRCRPAVTGRFHPVATLHGRTPLSQPALPLRLLRKASPAVLPSHTRRRSRCPQQSALGVLTCPLQARKARALTAGAGGWTSEV